MKNALILVGVATLAGVASVATAQGPAITGFTGGSAFNIFYGSSTGDMIGLRFTADTAMTVTSLGVADDPSDGVLDSAHMVGLWRNSDQALLASVLVDSTGTLLSGFYYETVAGVNLVAGGQYTIAAMYTATDSDSYTSGPSSVSLDGISSTNGVFPSIGDLGFVFPTEDSLNLGRFGANFIWRVIPAPSSFALLGLGGLVATRRRR